jgi:dipeptidase E
VRLYLSSFRVGAAGERLGDLTRGGRRAAVIANAIDHAPAEVREAGVQRELNDLEALGFEPHEIDLRDVPRGDHLMDLLSGFDLVWLRGGNVFLLRSALALSGADLTLTALLDEDALVYGGYSAGPCVLGPSLRALERCDDPAVVTDTYGTEVVWDGLGLIDFAFVPHVDSPEHPETDALGEVAEEYRRVGVPHRTLRDGEVIVVDGENETFYDETRL